MRSILQSFCFYGLYFQNFLPSPSFQRFFSYFSSKSIIVLYFISKSRLIVDTSCPVLESTISARSPCSFYWRMILESKIGSLDVVIATSDSLFPGSLYISVCKHLYLYSSKHEFMFYLFINY